MNESAVNGSEGTDTMLLDKIDFNVHIGLPGGIEPEDIALHRGAELEMPMNEVKRVDVAQHRAKQRKLLREVDYFAEQGTMDQIAVHIVVHLAIEGAVAVDHHTELRRAEGEILGEMDFARTQFNGTGNGPKVTGASQQTRDQL